MLHKKRENKWIKACKAQDRKVQREVYEYFHRKMFFVCLRYMKQEEDAEEVMVNGFLRVFDKITQFKNEGSFEGWIRKIMVNECLTQLRKKKLLFVEVEAKHLSRRPVENEAESNLSIEELLACIHRLPEGYRTIFNLYAIEGYSHQEIAAQLGISEGTSKSQLSRARRLLQDYVESQENVQKNSKNGEASYR